MANRASKDFHKAHKVSNKAFKEDHQVANGTNNKECHRGRLRKKALMLTLRKMGARKEAMEEVVVMLGRLEVQAIISGSSCCEKAKHGGNKA